MTPRKPTPPETDDNPRYQDEEPMVIGDFGQDDAFSTESHPEGLRYGERKRPPGVEYKGELEGPDEEDPDEDPDDTPRISVGSDTSS